MNRPPALVQMALDYATAYPEEIEADLALAERRRQEAPLTLSSQQPGRRGSGRPPG